MSSDRTHDERLGIFQQILTSRVYEVVSETALEDAKNSRGSSGTSYS